VSLTRQASQLEAAKASAPQNGAASVARAQHSQVGSVPDWWHALVVASEQTCLPAQKGAGGQTGRRQTSGKGLCVWAAGGGTIAHQMSTWGVSTSRRVDVAADVVADVVARCATLRRR
jgi:hypothetical protein